MRGERRIALDHRHRPRPPALVGRRKLRRAAERESRDHLDRERRGVIVVDDDGDVGLGLPHPLLRLLEAREHPLPIRLLGLAVVERRADGGHMRRTYSCDDSGHGITSVLLIGIWLCWISLWRLWLAGFRLAGFGFYGRLLRRSAGNEFRRRVLARARAVAFDIAAAAEHHLGVVVLGVAGHHRGEVLERMAVGGAELGGEIDVAAELQHAVVIALEYGVGLLRRQLELLQIFRLVRLEGLAVLVLHQRHAEHVDAEALAGPFGVEHKSARDIVVIVLFAGHRSLPFGRLFRSL